MNRLALKLKARAVKHALVAGGARAALFSAGLLPEGVLLGPLAGLAGAALFRALGKRAADQLQSAFPGMERDQALETARSVCRNFGRIPGELLLARRRGWDYLEPRVEIEPESLANFRAGLEGGKGLIVISAHMGNWELLAWWGARHSELPVAVLGKRIRNPGLNRLVNGFRELGGVEVMDRDDPPRRMLRHLGRPGILGILPDQDVDVLAGEFLEFFGKPAYTSTGPAALSLASGAPMVPSFLLRRGEGFLVRFLEPIRPERGGSKKEEILRLTKAWSAAVEETIRAFPDQWAWFHKRWASTPETVARKRRRYIESRKRKALARQGGAG